METLNSPTLSIRRRYSKKTKFLKGSPHLNAKEYENDRKATLKECKRFVKDINKLIDGIIKLTVKRS